MGCEGVVTRGCGRFGAHACVEDQGDVLHLSWLEDDARLGVGCGGFRAEEIGAGLEVQAKEDAVRGGGEAVCLDAIFRGEAQLDWAGGALGLDDAAAQRGVRGVLRGRGERRRQRCHV